MQLDEHKMQRPWNNFNFELLNTVTWQAKHKKKQLI